ncbi:MAG TPA: DUF3667 domain-containing protein [Flavobacterium sp.]|jgi:hypothetical protein
MTNNKCLNCEKELIGAYCFGCGQKADTHRISFKNFVLHDLMHGTFHIERGMLFTAKQALICPGKAALDYISGKRKRYYNVFYLVLLTIGVMLFTRHVDDMFTKSDTEIVHEKVYLNEASKKVDETISEQSRNLLLLFLPFAALNSFLLFRRKKLNLSEHFIISGMILLGILLISTFGNFLFYLNMITRFSGTFLSWIVASLIIFYVGYGYFNAFATNYSRLGVAWRIMSFFVLICLEAAILFFILFGFVTNWKFGSIRVTPFG